ncbi:hypothetical protein [Pararhodobacter sp. SW119]|uniref:hypothetical protein n=1 Tax=Pararhodobacter sp. SW119 TaxID=2780075 RepID=UPI001ADFC35D|nr:hypothetical protein [Pararhodobacter sp. SW119]
MRRATLLVTVLVITVPFTSALPQSETSRNLLLLFSQAECINRNAARYLEFVEGPTLIFPGFCEDELFDPSPAQVAALTSENAFGQSSILLRPSEGGAPVERSRNEKATAVVLTEDHIVCLSQRFADVVRRQTWTLEDGGSVEMAEILLDIC